MKVPYTLPFLLLLSLTILSAQDGLVGYVIDQVGTPLLGATLAVYEGERFVHGYTTDEFGAFTIKQEQFDRVEVRYLGYQETVIDYPTLVANNWIELEADRIDLETVVVIDYRTPLVCKCCCCRCCAIRETIEEEVPQPAIEVPELILKVYPNPTADLVRINIPEETDGRLELFAANGTRLAEFPCSGATMDIDLSAYPAGTYYFRYFGKAAEPWTGQVLRID